MSLIAEWRGQRFSEHKDRTIEITQLKTREKIDWGEKLDEDNLRDLWNYNKRSDIHVVRIPGEEKENGDKKVSREIMTESFSNLARGINLQM